MAGHQRSSSYYVLNRQKLYLDRRHDNSSFRSKALPYLNEAYLVRGRVATSICERYQEQTRYNNVDTSKVFLEENCLYIISINSRLT